MYEPKADVYTILSGIADVVVYQRKQRPVELAQFPCIVFSVGDNTPEYVLQKEIGSQTIEIVIDLYSETSAGNTSLLKTLQATMLENDYRLVFNQDVADEEVHHITTRFNLIR